LKAKLAHDLEIKPVGLRSVDETPLDASWERDAENWVRWVRRPGHDSYWYYRSSFFDEIVFIIRGSYFGRRTFEGHFERDGLEMTFRGWMYALEDYWRALEAAGFVVERLREPVATEDAVARQPAYRRWTRLPLFLQLRAEKP
jgi:hypothetical protein